jgi:DNA-binding response OmpR family regulator
MAAENDRARVLVVEDDDEMARLLQRGLVAEGYRVDRASDGTAALISSQMTAYTMALIDVMLPGMSGFELCRRLRAVDPSLLMLMLTARDDVSDRVHGLESGADDYVVKPFVFSELTARMRALRRRESAVPRTAFEAGNLLIDSRDHSARIAGRPIHLSPKEFALLRLLALDIDRTVPRERILAEIWDGAPAHDANIVDQYVSYLRKKLDPLDTGLALVTVRGVGFTLALEP